MGSNSPFSVIEKWLSQQEVGLSLKYRVKNRFKFVRVDYIYFGYFDYTLFWRYLENVVFDYNVQIYITTSYYYVTSYPSVFVHRSTAISFYTISIVL